MKAGAEPAGSKTYSITQLSEEFSVTPRAIRFYEDKGLLHPRRDGQTRIYSQRDWVRLLLILRGKRVGFSLAELRDILDLYDLGDGQTEQIRRTLLIARNKAASLERQRQDIDQTLVELTNACGFLEGLLKERGIDPHQPVAAPKRRKVGTA
ncbi:MerR family transcriptional regulator [Zavarzinia compransoris]|uniref:MerR family transcriptional regulator n=1 Tax=Zavarzinia compransoris TaxID=1264899 RepID=A0A317DYQ3_9PROT|nr:MerR family DNA-binding transcriptional regulator [Zavarzinia compransoris]PWR18986.1 MerR family transcriptional regulator [Zavarzinia compransoris]TDP48987.1 DNA-binding transcriptional MerR regulator [Zavarzinia compransoris]